MFTWGRAPRRLRASTARQPRGAGNFGAPQQSSVCLGSFGALFKDRCTCRPFSHLNMVDRRSEVLQVHRSFRSAPKLPAPHEGADVQSTPSVRSPGRMSRETEGHAHQHLDPTLSPNQSGSTTRSTARAVIAPYAAMRPTVKASTPATIANRPSAPSANARNATRNNPNTSWTRAPASGAAK